VAERMWRWMGKVRKKCENEKGSKVLRTPEGWYEVTEEVEEKVSSKTRYAPIYQASSDLESLLSHSGPGCCRLGPEWVSDASALRRS